MPAAPPRPRPGNGRRASPRRRAPPPAARRQSGSARSSPAAISSRWRSSSFEIAATENPTPLGAQALFVDRIEDLRAHLDGGAGEAVIRLAAVGRRQIDQHLLGAPVQRLQVGLAGFPASVAPSANVKTPSPLAGERDGRLLQAQRVHRLVQDVLQAVQVDALRSAALQDLSHADVLQPRQRVHEARVGLAARRRSVPAPGACARRSRGRRRRRRIPCMKHLFFADLTA